MFLLIKSLKSKLFVRIVSLPDIEDVYVGYPTAAHINKLICFNGTVTKAFASRMVESSQTYVCNKCGYQFSMAVDLSQVDLFVKPAKCQQEDCSSDKFKIVSVESNKSKYFIENFCFYFIMFSLFS